MSLNKVMIIGHLGQDPEIRYTPTGLPVVNFSVATDEAYVDKEGKRQERVEWHRVVVHARVGEQRNERTAHRDRRQPRAVPRRSAERCESGRAFGGSRCWR